MDVHHAELVDLAAGPAGLGLAGRQVAVSLGLELELAGPVLEHVKGLVVGHFDQRLGGARSGLLGAGYLGRLVERHRAPSQGGIEIGRGLDGGAGGDGLAGLSQRGARGARHRGRVSHTGRETRDPEAAQLHDAAVGVDQRAGLGPGELVGPQPGVGPLDQRQGIGDVLLDRGGLELFIEDRSHRFIMTRVYDRFSFRSPKKLERRTRIGVAIYRDRGG